MSMNEFETYEYVVTQKKSGALILRRIILIAVYVAFVAAMPLLAMLTRIGAPLVALMPFGLVLLIFLTWRYTQVEFEYSVTSGEVTVSKIFGGKSRRVIAQFRIRDCRMIAPATDRLWAEKAELFAAQTRVTALSFADSPRAYFAAFEPEKGERGIVYFEANQKMLRVCHYYNREATVLTKVD